MRMCPAIASLVAIAILTASATAGCGDVNAALERLVAARQLSADLLIQFTKAADAANRAVMADTDELSVAFAQEAAMVKQGVQRDTDRLRPMLQGLGFADETRLLEEFATRFAAYDVLDRRILDLAVENTNLKAQRLSFGPAQNAADAFRDSVEALVPADPARDTWRIKALVATAVAMVREIQVLQAPHIAEPADVAMTQLEKRMSSSEATARTALRTLAPLVQPESRPRLVAATSALDRFMGLNTQILALSRRNTNVRSLALSLDEKRKLVAPCEESLRALKDALTKRRYPSGR